RKPDGQLLLSIGNYTDTTRKITLNFDWEALGLDPAKTILTTPEVKDLQPAMRWNPDSEIKVQPRKGWLIYATQQ
ncbi:MAG: hypothetical protein K2M11_10030, partial [Paramuribaculum sp.]|nr:hypothetical protein [Paramuribaculum sp.]